MSEISENDIWILSYYRASELAGSLVMGRLAEETDDDELRVNLTEHCAEEARHAWMWTETLRRLGALPRRVRETYQSRYYACLGPPRTMLEILALTQVFERRVVRHFRAHLSWPDTHPLIAETLRAMIDDEAGHISWVRKWLDRYAADHGTAVVEQTLRAYEAADREIYAQVIGARDRLSEIVAGATSSSNRDSDRSDVAEFIAATLGIDPKALAMNASLRSVGVNSLDLVMLVTAMEERFRITFVPADLERLATLGDLVERVMGARETEEAVVSTLAR